MFSATIHQLRSIQMMMAMESIFMLFRVIRHMNRTLTIRSILIIFRVIICISRNTTFRVNYLLIPIRRLCNFANIMMHCLLLLKTQQIWPFQKYCATGNTEVTCFFYNLMKSILNMVFISVIFPNLMLPGFQPSLCWDHTLFSWSALS